MRPELVDYLVKMLNCNVLPVITEQSSVGCSGDLAPGWLGRSPAFQALVTSMEFLWNNPGNHRLSSMDLTEEVISAISTVTCPALPAFRNASLSRPARALRPS